jgi:hypothetical protein
MGGFGPKQAEEYWADKSLESVKTLRRHHNSKGWFLLRSRWLPNTTKYAEGEENRKRGSCVRATRSSSTRARNSEEERKATRGNF